MNSKGWRLPLCVVGLGLFACGKERARELRKPPTLRVLQTDVVVPFHVSAMAPLSECRLAVVDRDSATVSILQRDGKTRRLATLGDAQTIIRLGGERGDSLLAWTHRPEQFVVLDTRREKVEARPAQTEIWNDHWTGPVTPLRDRFVMAPLGDADIPRARPMDAAQDHLLQILDGNGHRVGGSGRIPNLGGRYLSWAAARATIGTKADTLLMLLHESGELWAFTLAHDTTLVSQWRVQLPKYFAAPQIEEEVRTMPWITVNGDFIRMQHVPHVAAAVITANGQVYAVRNYSAAKHNSPSKLFQTQETWQPDAHGLEVYDAHGNRLDALRLPDRPVTSMSADSSGTIFFTTDRGVEAMRRRDSQCGHASVAIGSPSRASYAVVRSEF